MDNTNDLAHEIGLLRAENARLKALLQAHGIAIPTSERLLKQADEMLYAPETTVTKASPMADKVALFLSLFRGRNDVYAKRWERQDGRSGYGPACKNEWKPHVCIKPQSKCAACTHADYWAYNEKTAEMHLHGHAVFGIYPLLSDNTCYFLAVDFDEESWRTDVRMVVQTCREQRIPCSVEISRSGNGAHLWVFFSEPVEASKARALGSAMLTKAMQEHARLSFKSYDRMFPNQDTMPKGGFGNLIALPLQMAAARHGGSLFVDDEMQIAPDQWRYLSHVQKMTSAQVDALLAQMPTTALGALRPDEDETMHKPWQKQETKLLPDDVPAETTITLADGIYIPTNGFSNRAQNQLKRLAAFHNPQFYRSQAMRMPVRNIPRVICCAEYQDNYLVLPRGCMEELMQWMQENKVTVRIDDERCSGRSICVTMNGQLREEQRPAFEALAAYETGVLSATTAFGKTVIGAALIAEKKVNTLILVHRAQLMEQWKERMTQFLSIDEELQMKPKSRGRQKQQEMIGCYGANRDTRGGIVDIAMIQSVGSANEIKPWIRDYGMVIVDECHHVPAVSFEQVFKQVQAKYVYGLTATPKRQDGHHPILYMYLGLIRYQVDAKQQAQARPFAHVMIPCFTGTCFQLNDNDPLPAIQQLYEQIMQDDLRNQQIIEDVLQCAKEDRNCLILSERTQHVRRLAQLLQDAGQNVHVLLGGQTNKQIRRQLTELQAATSPIIVCATGKFIGEGFDDSRLDTLFLTMPISWHGMLAQYVGRLHRLHEGKREVRVYDYIDLNVQMLERMYHKRLKGYASLDYSVSLEQDNALSDDIIYDQNTFQMRFLQDVEQARNAVCIVSPYVTVRRVNWILSSLRLCIRKRVAVTILTRSPETFQPASCTAANAAMDILRNEGCAVETCRNIHQKYAVVDGRIVWYGSINLLSFGASQESMMRLVSGNIARRLEEMGRTQRETLFSQS